MCVYNLEEDDDVFENQHFIIESNCLKKCLTRHQEKIIVPDGITTICSEAFVTNHAKEIILPNTVKRIEAKAFTGSYIETMVIPDSVEILGFDAFYGCDNLKYIKLSRNIKELDVGTFNRCTKLKEIIIPEKCTVIKPLVFWCCNSLKTIVLHKNIELIHPDAFLCVHKYLEIIIPDDEEIKLLLELNPENYEGILEYKDEIKFLSYDKIKKKFLHQKK